jgi:hypothetical protein
VDDLLTWLKDYSPAVVALIAAGAVFLFVAKTVVEKAVTARLDAYAEDLRLRLGRRSGFEEKILTDRYVAFSDLFMRLQRITTTLKRGRSGQPLPDGFIVGNDIVPLTEVYEELNVREMLLGPRLHAPLTEAARVALELANARSSDDWPALEPVWLRAVARLKTAADEEFGLGTIRW